MLKEHGDKISGDEKTAVESALADAKKAIEGSDPGIMNSARERLTQASHKLAEVMYKSPQSQPGTPCADARPGAGQGEKNKAQNVVAEEKLTVEAKKGTRQ